MAELEELRMSWQKAAIDYDTLQTRIPVIIAKLPGISILDDRSTRAQSHTFRLIPFFCMIAKQQAVFPDESGSQGNSFP